MQLDIPLDPTTGTPRRRSLGDWALGLIAAGLVIAAVYSFLHRSQPADDTNLARFDTASMTATLPATRADADGTWISANGACDPGAGARPGMPAISAEVTQIPPGDTLYWTATNSTGTAHGVVKGDRDGFGGIWAPWTHGADPVSLTLTQGAHSVTLRLTMPTRCAEVQLHH